MPIDRQGWDERYSASEQTFTAQPNRLIVAEVAPLTPGRALDVAAGEGRHARWLAGLGWRVVAVDFSLVGVAKAAAAARAAAVPVAWMAADVHSLALPPSAFDLVVAAFFHPRPAERHALYSKVAATLAPGGRFVQVSYDLTHLGVSTTGPQDPEVLIQPEEVAERLRSLGLVVHRAETVPLKVPTDDGEIDVVNAVIVAERPRLSGPG